MKSQEAKVIVGGLISISASIDLLRGQSFTQTTGGEHELGCLKNGIGLSFSGLRRLRSQF